MSALSNEQKLLLLRDKKRRTEVSIAQSGLQLAGRRLPTSIDYAICHQLDVWDMGALGFTSKGLRLTVLDYLKVATNCNVRNTTHPMQRLYAYWLIGQMRDYCRKLQVIRVTWSATERDKTRDKQIRNMRKWVTQLIENNKGTLQRLGDVFNMELMTAKSVKALCHCPNLRELRHACIDQWGLSETNKRIQHDAIKLAVTTRTQLHAVQAINTTTRLHDGFMIFGNELAKFTTREVLGTKLPIRALEMHLFPEVVGMLGKHVLLTRLCLTLEESMATAKFYRDLSAQLSELPKLKTLILYTLPLPEANHGIVWRLPTVTELEFACHRATSEQVIPIEAPELLTFRCDRFSDPSAAMIAQCAKLQSYSIQEWGESPAETEWSSLLERITAGRGKQLHSLTLDQHQVLGAETLAAIGSQWTQLHIVNVIWSRTVAEEKLWQLLWQLPRLEVAHFHISERTSPAAKVPESKVDITPLQKEAKHLRTLYLEIAHTSVIQSNPIAFPNLIDLTLKSRRGGFASDISISNLNALLARMPRLTSLSASSAKLTAGNVELPRLALRSINLGSTPSLTSAGVMQLVTQSVATLRRLTLVDCTERSILLDLANMSPNAPPLEKIVFSHGSQRVEPDLLRPVLQRYAPTLHRFWMGVGYNTENELQFQSLQAEWPNVDIARDLKRFLPEKFDELSDEH